MPAYSVYAIQHDYKVVVTLFLRNCFLCLLTVYTPFSMITRLLLLCFCVIVKFIEGFTHFSVFASVILLFRAHVATTIN